MNVMHFLTIFALYLGSFFLMPDRIMLSMASRFRSNFHRHAKVFPYFAKRRIACVAISLPLTLSAAFSQFWGILVPLSLGLWFIVMYIWDFIIIERIFLAEGVRSQDQVDGDTTSEQG